MQLLEFQFLSDYTLEVDVVLLGQSSPTVANLPATDVGAVSATVRRYQVSTSGLAGHYQLVCKHLGIVVMTDRVYVPTTADGTYYAEAIIGITLPNPDKVHIGINRGDGILGTLVPCFDPVRTVTSEMAITLSQNQLVEMLSITGSRTKSLARVSRVLGNELYEVVPELTKKVVVLKRDRLLPIFLDV